MGKRSWSLVLSLALVAGILSAAPAVAQEAPAPAIPEVANIEDPFGDANTLAGDQVTPVDGGSQTDIGKVWFTHDADNLNAHFLTEGPPNANSLGFQFVVTAGEAGCLVIDGLFDGTTYTSENLGRVIDNCNGLDLLAEGTSFTFGPAPEGTGGLATITVPRSYSPLFADGSVLVQPKATTWIFVGGQQVYDATQTYRGVRQRIDDTKAGTDYAISGGPVVEPEPDPTVEPPGKNDPPGKGKKKGCDKGKGKKKGACPGEKPGKPGKPGKAEPPAGSCAPFEPGEAGAEKPTLTVTDDATEAKPIEQKVKLDASLANARLLSQVPAAGPLAATKDTFNIQVDTKAADSGLWVLVEFAPRRDFDLNLLHTDGSYAARARSWNSVIGTPASLFSAPGHGGEGTDHSEKLLGIRTGDCGGWTLAVENHFGEAAEVTVKMWLGDATIDPQEVGKEKPA